MQSAKEALEVTHRLADYVVPVYRLHLIVVTAIVGFYTTALGVKGFDIGIGARFVIVVMYGLVAFTTYVALDDTFKRFNAGSKIAEQLLKAELANKGEFDKEIEALTLPVEGIVYKRYFPRVAAVFAILILIAPGF